MENIAFQDRIPDNHCFGCGPENAQGLRIKSYWTPTGGSACEYHPGAHMAAGPREVLNGGIISTLIDCHSICTAVAEVYRREERPIGSAPLVWFVTGELQVRFLRPASLLAPVRLLARVEETTEKKTRIACTLRSGEEVCAEANLLAVRVPWEWGRGHHH